MPQLLTRKDALSALAQLDTHRVKKSAVTSFDKTFPQRFFDTQKRVVDTFVAEAGLGAIVRITSENWDGRSKETKEYSNSTGWVRDACIEAHLLRVRCDLIQFDGSDCNIIEVRPIARVRSRHISAAAVTTWTLNQAGYKVNSYRFAIINTEWNGLDQEPRFILSDVSTAVTTRSNEMDDDLARIAQGLPPPMTEASSTPEKPVQHPSPEGDIGTLYRVKKRIVNQLLQNGYTRLAQIPDDVPLPPIADRQRTAAKTNRMVVAPQLKEALDAIRRPTVYIDFEAIQPALPIWTGCRPFGLIPVQVSIHRQDCSGDVRHSAWLAPPMEDPRPGLAGFLADQLDGSETLVAYHASFERSIISRLSAFCSPENAEKLKRANQSFVDLLPLVRNNVYHPNFVGKFNLKQVVSALLPELDYADLPVRRGDDASRLLEALIMGNVSESSPDYKSLRTALLDYCERDTWVMVQLESLLRQACA